MTHLCDVECGDLTHPHDGRVVPQDRVVAWDRTPGDSCQASTPGCSIDHDQDPGGCETW